PYRGPAHEVLRRVQTESPPPVDERQRGVARELRAIVDKAMARDPADRYPSAKELAAELRRFITGQLVRAHHYSRARLLVRWLQKHQLATVTLGLVAVIGSLSITRIVRERNRAEEARAVAESRQRELLLVQARSALEADPTMAAAWLKSYLAAGGDAAPAWAIAAEAASRGVARAVFDAETATVSPDGSTVATVEPAPRGLAVWHTADGTRRALGVIDDETDRNPRLMFSPDGRALATLGTETLLWDLSTGRSRQLGDREHDKVYELDFRPDGREVMLRGFEQITVVDLASGQKRSLPDPCRIEARCFATVYYAPDGRLRTIENDDTTIRIGNFGGAVEHRLRGEPRGLVELAHSRDEMRFALGGKNVRLWDLASGTVRAAPVAGSDRVDISRDGRRIAWIDDHGAVVEWMPDTNEVQSLGHDGVEVTSVEFTPRGDVASVARDHTVRIWDPAGFPRLTLHARQDLDLEFSDDGSALLTSAGDDGSRLWNVAVLPRVVGRAPTGIRQLAVAADGRTLAVAAVDDPRVHLFAVDGARPYALDPDREQPRALALAPTGDALAETAGGDARLCSLPAGPCRTLHFAAKANHVVFAPDGKSLAVSGADGMVRLVDSQGRLLRELRGQEQDALRAVFSPAGDRLAIVGLDAALRVFDLVHGTSRTVAARAVTELAFAPDGGRIAFGGDDGVVRVATLASGETSSLRIGVDKVAVNLVAFSPDGETIAASCADRTVTLWEPRSGRVRRLEGHDETVLDLAFSRDGKYLATASDDRTVRLWAVAPAHVAAIWRGHTGPVRAVRFSADGRFVYSGADDGTVRQWPLDNVADGDDGRALLRWLDRTTTVTLGHDGRPSWR
ncbi:MAG TPA: hypothetical protein VF945_03395, partial [Polyangia bacterium]